MLKYENFIIVISSPSGAGKTTLVNKLLEKYNNIQVSISATTRSPREGEINNIHYHFFSKEEFEKKIKENAFIEYAKVHDNYYGTLKSEVESKWNNNNDIILNIDYQGAINVSKLYDNKHLIKIFILPPSLKELKNRLINRNQDSIEVINTRMENSIGEISFYNNYEFIIINEQLDVAFTELESLIITKRKQNVYKNELDNFIKNL